MSESSEAKPEHALPQRIPAPLDVAPWPLHPAEVYAVFSEALRNLDAEPEIAAAEHDSLTEVRAASCEQPSVTSRDPQQEER